MKLLFPLLLGAGLLGPGWLLGRALRASGGWVTAFAGSAAILTNLLIFLDLFGVPLATVPVAIALGAVCATLILVDRLRGSSPSAENAPSTRTSSAEQDESVPRSSPLLFRSLVRRTARWWNWQSHFWYLFPVVVSIAAIIAKAAIHPLSGYDTFFRWDFLARQMLRVGSLDFYPAVTARDFNLYGWCDGIAPLISGLYFWSYISLGRVAAWATTPVVALQAIALFGAVYQLAARAGGAAAGCAATAVLAGSSILLWGVAMGQETGLTALALTTMFLCLERSRDDSNAGWLVWAGLAAALGSLAREYGLLFIAIGLLDLGLRRAQPRQWLCFGAGALTFALPWYFRNWIRTGNPLWPHPIAPVFATNKLHNDYMDMVAAHLGIGSNSALFGKLLLSMIVLVACPLFFGICGFLRPGRRFAEVTATLLMILLWLYSIGQTSAGATYSLRVLTPALALCAVAGGRFLASWARSDRKRLIAALLTLAAIDAAGRSNFVDVFPFIPWWRVPFASWVQPRDASVVWNTDRTWPVMAAAAGGEKLIVSDPFEHAALAKLGARPVPFFSPEIAFLFEPTSSYDRCLQQLVECHFRFILLSTNPGINTMILAKYPFFQTLQSRPPTVKNPSVTVYDLYVLTHPNSGSDGATVALRR